MTYYTIVEKKHLVRGIVMKYNMSVKATGKIIYEKDDIEIEADNESHAAEIVLEMVRAGNLLSDDDVVDSTIPVSDESLSAGYTEIEVGVDENG